MNTSDPRELSSWKEIAAYLGVSVKTAQLWERERGLPVRRLPGQRSGVHAVADELDAWKRSGTPAEGMLSPRLPLLHPRRVVPLLIGLLLAVGSGWWFWPRAVPAGFRIEPLALVVLDGSGQELWRQSFPEGLLAGDYSAGEQRFWVGDLTGDGDPEVLFVPIPPGVKDSTIPLICYNSRGQELWRFLPGQTVRTSAGEYAPPFVVRRFEVLPDHRVLTTSHHASSFPSQVALLSPTGAVLREYWHSGHLNQLAVADLDHDGHVEAYLGGVNNGRHAATLVVLDPDRFNGAASESGRYQLQGFGPPVERARYLFPRSCMNERLEPYNDVTHLTAGKERLTVDVHERLGSVDPPSIQYELDARLNLLDVGISDVFFGTHAQLQASGQLDHAFTDGERQALRALIRIQ